MGEVGEIRQAYFRECHSIKYYVNYWGSVAIGLYRRLRSERCSVRGDCVLL